MRSTKTSGGHSSVWFAAIGVVALSQVALGQATYYWDAQVGGGQAPIDGSANWGITNNYQHWALSQTDKGNTQWINSPDNFALFGASGTPAGNNVGFTSTLRADIIAGGITFDNQFGGPYTVLPVSGSNFSLTLGTTTTAGTIVTNRDATIDAPLAGTNHSLVKSGAATLTLSGTSTYTGPTTVAGGSLMVNGSIASSSLTTVQSGATLAGTGTVGAVDTVTGATVSPGEGTSAGTLTIGSWSGTGTYSVNVTGPAASDADRLVVVAGPVADLEVKVATLPTLGEGVYTWLIAEANSFSAYLLDVSAFSSSAGQFSLWATESSPGQSQLYLTYNAVPEATTLLLGLAGLTPVLLQRRGSKRA